MNIAPGDGDRGGGEMDDSVLRGSEEHSEQGKDLLREKGLMAEATTMSVGQEAVPGVLTRLGSKYGWEKDCVSQNCPSQM